VKSKPDYWFCETWCMNYYYFIGWKWSDFKAYLSSEYAYTVERDVEPTGHCIMMEHPKGAIIAIWVKKKTDIGSLAHECLHAANWTLERAGWTPQLWNDEPQAYLMMGIIRGATKTESTKRR